MRCIDLKRKKNHNKNSFDIFAFVCIVHCVVVDLFLCAKKQTYSIYNESIPIKAPY